MPIAQVRKDIHQFIRENRIQSAFNHLWDILNPDADFYKDLLLVQYSFSNTCEDYRLGLIKRDEYNLGCMQSINGLLEMCNDLKDKDLLLFLDNKPPASSSVVVKNSYQAHIHIQNGKSLKKTGNFSGSIHEFRRAVALKPQSISTKTDLAAVLRQDHQYDEAIQILADILQSYPRDAHSRNELASCYREQHQLGLAVDILHDGLKLVEENSFFHTNLFYIHLFFTCNVKTAIDTKNKYTSLTGKELIYNTEARKKYNLFIHHFDDIHSGKPNHEINGHYINECISEKKAYKTAANLLKMLSHNYPDLVLYKVLRKGVPPQYF